MVISRETIEDDSEKCNNMMSLISNMSEKQEKPNIIGDRLNCCLLTILYLIQGLPVGLSFALPVILQSKKAVTYKEQATLSIAIWSYNMKILWAPMVDSLYLKCLGRRKSWLLPLQILTGLSLLYMAYNIDDWLPESGNPNLKMLILMIFAVNLLTSTLDIVVDGWALTMLKMQNISYASTCNSVGVTLGIFIGNICFTLLVSEEFNNTYFRTMPGTGGLTTMKSFLIFWGFAILSITILIGVLKKEKDNMDDLHVKFNIFQNYRVLWNILCRPRIRVLGIALLTSSIGFAATDIPSHLKFIDAGVSKDYIMFITTIAFAIKFTMSIFVSKYITGRKPMSYYLKVMPIRLLWAITYIVLIYYSPSIILYKNGSIDVPVYYYCILGSIIIINDMLNFFMLLALLAFFCRLSDPRFGGTYMTLFNTFYFLGYLASNTLVLELIAVTTIRRCSNDDQNYCSTPDLENMCQTIGGSCTIYLDGYYTANIVCMVAGFIWYGIFQRVIKTYQSLNISSWVVFDNIRYVPNENIVKENPILSN